MRAILASAAPLAIATALFQSPAIAQEAGGQASELSEVVVTAQKREENLQDVPIAMTAMSGAALADRNVTTVELLVGTVPSLSIGGNSGVNASNLFAIRGVSGQPLPIGASQAVALYLDGVYLSRPEAAIFTLADVQRVEVLRGPQGTLYGRNTTAGAINVITRDPSQALFGALDASVGSDEAYELRAAIGGRLGGGFSASASIGASGHGPWFTNAFNNRDVGEADSLTGRLKLGYDSEDERLRVRLSADASRTNATLYFTDILGGPGHTSYVGVTDPELVYADSDPGPKTRRRAKGLGLTVDYDVSDALSLTSVTGLRRVTARTRYDGDASTFIGNRTHSENESETFSQEFRLFHNGERFRLTAGLSYYREEGSFLFRSLTAATPSPVYLEFGAIAGIPRDGTTINSYAAFAQGEYDLMPTLTLVLAGRLNHEKRRFTVDYTAVPGGTAQTGHMSESAFLPQAGLNYRPSDDVLLYAKVSQGYQTPGFNFAPGVGQPLDPFDSETVWAYEVGAKTAWMDNRLVLNLAAYYYDYKDLQVRSTVGTGITIVSNAQATLKGVELEAIVRLAQGLALDGHVTYSRGRFGAFCQTITGGSPQAGDPLCGPGLADRSGNQLILAPDWQGGVGLRYERDLSSELRLKANLNLAFESSFPYQTAVEAASLIPSSERLDARVALVFGNGFEVYGFGRNLFDERHPTSAFRLAPTIAFVAMNDPRVIGVGAKYAF